MKGYELQKMLSDKFSETGRGSVKIIFVEKETGDQFAPTGEMVIDTITDEGLVYVSYQGTRT